MHASRILGCRLLASLAVLAWLVAAPAAAQILQPDLGGDTGPFEISADSVEFETERQIYIARGNVRIGQQGRVLTADWLAFSNATQQGVASGNVVVAEGGDRLFADVLHFEIDELKGIVFQGRLEAGGNDFVVVGDTMRKTGENQYEFEDATFTTCRCPEGKREPWTI